MRLYDFLDSKINVGGYIGSSTRAEIAYAMKSGKPIRYLERMS